ncbi:polycystin-1-like protein 2 [Glandiceps talaboti]
MVPTNDAVTHTMKTVLLILATGIICTVSGTTAPASTLEPCPDGWVEFNDKCYLFQFDDTKTWHEARTICQGLTPGGDLLVYDNSNTNGEKDFINNQLSSISHVSNVWIGIEARFDDYGMPAYYWINGQEVVHGNWESGQPDNLWDAPCVFLLGDPLKANANGIWSPALCNTGKGYMCDVDRGYHTTTQAVTTKRIPESVNVTCFVNCGLGDEHRKVNPSDIILVKAYCTECPLGVQRNYTWSLKMYNSSILEKVHVDMSDEDFTSTGTRSRSISINEFKLDYGQQYFLKVLISYYRDDGEIFKSFGEISFTTNLQPYNGNCAVSNTTGYALETKFVISCDGWYDEGALDTKPVDPTDASTNLIYSFYTMSHNSVTKTRTLLQSSNNTNTNGIYFELGNLTVYARVTDMYGEYIETSFFVEVKPAPNSVAKAFDIISELGDTADVGEMTSLFCAVASVLNTGGDEGEEDTEAKETRSKVRTAMINGLEKMSTSVTSMDGVGQAAKALDSVTATPEEITGETQSKAASALKSVSGTFSSFEGMRETDKVSTVTDITSGAGNVLTASSGSSTKIEALKVDPLSASFDYESSEPSPEELEAEREKSKYVAGSIVEATDMAADALLRGKPSGSKPITVDTSSLKMSLQRDKPSDLGGKQIGSDGGSFKLPSSSSLLSKRRRRDVTSNEDDDEDEQSVAVVMKEISKNCYNPQEMNSKVLSLQLKEDDGSDIEVKNIKDPIEINIQNKNDVPTPNGYAVNETGMYYVKFKVAHNHTAVRITVRPVDRDLAVNYTVYLRHMYSPTMTKHIISQEMPRTDFAVIPHDKGDDSLREDWNYTVFVPASQMNMSGDYHVGVFHTLDNTTYDTEGYNMTVQTITTACKYWDIKNTKWSQDGCETLQWSSSRTTVCACNHLTSFAADLYVAPNTIDFGTVFQKFANLGENASVFSTIFVIFGLYVAGVIFCRRADKRDLIKWGVLPLSDNDPDHRYYYQVNVHTGTKVGSGTKSRVSFTLFGTIMNSGTRKMEDSERDADMLYEKGSITKFIVATHGPLGRLLSLRIWHDNSGKGAAASWFLTRVEVIDVQTDNKYFFLCDKWLAVEKGDGKVERFLRSASDEDMTRFSNLFSFTTRKEFTDGHIWFSVLSRPNRSNFSRVQRLSCCLSLLYLTMIANCMFFRTDNEKAGVSDKLFSLGPLEFSLKELYVSVVSSLVVFPPSIVLVQLFRKCKAKQSVEVSPKRTQSIIKHNRSTQVTDGHDNDDAAKKYITNSASSERLVASHDKDESWKLFKDNQTKRPLSAFHITIDDDAHQVKSHGKASFGIGDDDSDYGSTADFDPERLTPRPGSSLDGSWVWSPRKMRDPLMPRSRPTSATDSVADNSKKKDKKGKEKAPFMLPHGFVYVAWLLMFLSSFASAFFTILYSMEWGHEKSVKWLISFFLSFFESLLLVQPAKVILLALFVALIWKKPEQIEGDVEDNKLKPDEEWLTTDMSAYEGIVTAEDTAEMETPLSPEELERARRKRFKEVKMKGVLKEIFVYSFYLAILLLITYGSRDLMARYEHMHLDNMFFDTPYMGKADDDFSIEEIDNGFNSYLQYIRAVVVPSLYADEWYNGDRLHWRQRRYISNYVTYRVGPARLRQLRVRPELCDAPPIMADFVKQCEVDYDISDTEDRQLYGDSWAPLNDSFTAPNNPYALPWLYASAEELDGGSLYGRITWYGGGGYTAEFGSTIEKAYDMVDYLEKTNWLDPLTRAVILEFTLYNAQTDLFSMVTLIAEFPSVGGGVAMRTIQVIRLYPFTGTFPEFLMACDIIFAGFIIFFIVEEVRQMKKEKRLYFKDYWNYLELAIIILSLIGIGMFIYKIPTRDIAVDSLHQEETGGKRAFLNLQGAALYEEIYNYILALLVFLSILKFMKLMRLNHHIAVMIATLSAARRDLVNFCIVFTVVFMAFGQMAYVIFSSLLLTYSTFLSTVETLLSTLLGAFDYEELVYANPIMGPIFFFAFIMTGMMILLNLFVTAVMMAYSTVQEDKSKFCDDYEIVDFIWGNVKEIIGLDSTEECEAANDDPPDVDVEDDDDETAEKALRQEALLLDAETPTKDTLKVPGTMTLDIEKPDWQRAMEKAKISTTPVCRRRRRMTPQVKAVADIEQEEDTQSLESVVDSLETRVDVLASFVGNFDEDGTNRPYTGVMNNYYDKATKNSDIMNSGGGMLLHMPQPKVIPKIVHVTPDDLQEETGEATDTKRRGGLHKKISTTRQPGHLGPWHISGSGIYDTSTSRDMADPHNTEGSASNDRLKNDLSEHQATARTPPCSCNGNQSIFDAGLQLRIHLPQRETEHMPGCKHYKHPGEGNGSEETVLPRRLPPLKGL